MKGSSNYWICGSCVGATQGRVTLDCGLFLARRNFLGVPPNGNAE